MTSHHPEAVALPDECIHCLSPLSLEEAERIRTHSNDIVERASEARRLSRALSDAAARELFLSPADARDPEAFAQALGKLVERLSEAERRAESACAALERLGRCAEGATS